MENGHPEQLKLSWFAAAPAGRVLVLIEHVLNVDDGGVADPQTIAVDLHRRATLLPTTGRSAG